MKLITKNEKKFGQQKIVKALGLISISETGVVDVPVGMEKEALEFLDGNLEFEELVQKAPAEKVKNSKKPGKEKEGEPLQTQVEESDLSEKSDENELGKEEENELGADNSASSLKDEEKQLLIDSLKELSFNELKEFAATSEFPKEEWETRRNSVVLLKYLEKKIQTL